MSFELIIRLTEIKLGICCIGGVGTALMFLAIVSDCFRDRILPIICSILFMVLFLTGIRLPTTEQYLAMKMAEENPPKTAEETLEIIKKSQIDYHHIRAEQYKGKKE